MTVHVLARSSYTHGESSFFRPVAVFSSRASAEEWLRALSNVYTDFYAKRAHARARFTPDGYWHWSDDGVHKEWLVTEVELDPVLSTQQP